MTENTVPEYTTTIDGTNITNSYAPGKTSMTVTKGWEDQNNQDGLRPESIQVQLYANGDAVGDPITLMGSNNWTHTWSELDQKANGQVIDYTVKEVTEIQGYETRIDDTDKGNILITNIHTPNSTTLRSKPKKINGGGGHQKTNNPNKIQVFPKTGEKITIIPMLLGVSLLGTVVWIETKRRKMKDK